MGPASGPFLILIETGREPVSYTHLDVYKRQYEARIAELEAPVADLEHQLAAKDYVAEFDGGYVTAEEAMKQYNYVEYMYSAYGYSMDGYEDYIKNDIAQSMLKDKIIQFKATELGLATPTDEEALSLIHI